jgi:hypothetical protein
MAEYMFPSDLSSYQQGHFMKIKIFPSTEAKGIGGQNTSEFGDTICLFIPGGNQNGSLIWENVHEYDDVKLARLGTGVIGAVTRMIPGGDLLAGAAGKALGMGLGAARVAGYGTINPKVDVLYGNSELRQFQFSFFMAPQSAKENDDLHTIVRLLRKFSAPEIVSTEINVPFGGGSFFGGTSGQGSQLQSGLWFKPPAEFDVSFYSIQDGRAAANQYLPKIGRCVLNRVILNFTQQGDFSTFKDGAPTNLQLDLFFREMRIISQADIDNGY